MGKHNSKSFERAVIEGDIVGPDWHVIDIETGLQTDAGNQDFRGPLMGRSTGRIVEHITSVIGTVEDFQFPADGPQPNL